MHCDAVTNPLSFTVFACVRTIFAIENHPQSPIAALIPMIFFPNTACTNKTSKSDGTERSTSTRRIKSLSSHAGDSALAVPYKTAITADIAADKKPMVRETRPPCHIHENRSRPIVSVPKKNSRPGAQLQFIRSI